MRSTTSLERFRNGVHPACVGLSRLINYHAPMWEETIEPAEGGSIGAEQLGLHFFPAPKADAVTKTQMLRVVEPAPGKLIIVAARIRPDHADAFAFRFGLSDNSLYEVFFEQEYTGTGRPWIYGRINAGLGPPLRTPDLFYVSNHFFIDYAIVLHGTSMADFIWERSHEIPLLGESEGTWGSVTLTSTIPLNPMRPFLFFRRGRNDNVGAFDVRGFVVREKTLRE